MRVIAGEFRSRPLRAPRGTATRPTSDRLRETLFNVLGPRVPGARFADLYAGSGAVGIEAISRGAAEVLFAETARAALEALQANLRSLRIATGYTVESGGTAPLLKRLASSPRPLDIVFLDPPYDAALEYSRTLATLGSGVPLSSGVPLHGDALLHPDAIVVAEHARKQTLQNAYGYLRRTRTLLQGDAALSFYALSALGEDAAATPLEPR